MLITLRRLMDGLSLELLTPGADMTREVTAGYCCDLLSWVLAHGAPGVAWITVQTHMNVVAVATLQDMACVILPENISPEADALAKASEEGVAVFRSAMNAYELSGKMWEMGLMSAERS